MESSFDSGGHTTSVKNESHWRSCVFAALVITVITSFVTTAAANTQDEGAAGWDSPIDVAAPYMVGQDLFGEMFCDSYQNLHLLWGKSHEDGSEIFYRNDSGGQWSDATDIIAVSESLAVRLSAAFVEQTRTLHLVWQSHWTKGELNYARAPIVRAGDPRAWTAPVQLLVDVDSAQILADSGGVLHLVYGLSEGNDQTNILYYVRSSDGGETWSVPTVAYEVTTPTPSFLGAATAIDDAGRIHVGITTRSQNYGDFSQLVYVRSRNGGFSWDESLVVATQSEQTPNVSVLAPYTFGADEVHLTWHDPRRMHMWSLDGGETWHEPVEIMTLGAGFGGANGLVKDSAGTLYAVSGVQNGVYVARWSGSEWEPPVQVEDREMDPHGQRIVVCQGNQLHVLYDDRVEEDTTVWYTHRTVDAPHIPQEPLPAEELPVDNVEGVSVLGGVGQPTAVPSVAASPPPVNISPLPPRQSTTIRLLLPVAVTNILIIGAMVTRRLRGS